MKKEMKKIIPVCLLALFFMKVEAVEIPLTALPFDYQGATKPQHAPALLPSVDYTNGVLTIYSPWTIDSMTVIIKDANGTVLYSTVVDVANTAVLNLPENILSTMETLEIIFGDRHLYGEF